MHTRIALWMCIDNRFLFSFFTFRRKGLGVQWKFCCPGHCQKLLAVACCSSMPLNMWQKLSSCTWTIWWWSFLRHWRWSGIDEPCRSWVMLPAAGLVDVGKSCLLVKWDDETGLVITCVLEISKLISELLSLPLLAEPSFSFFRWITWPLFESLFFRDTNCKSLSNCIKYLQLRLI